ncbi:MAG: hypothetical protein KW788_01945 [Candidatus Doudnabacteria bacterium]|nr:hypothetical protein [Candidatus Doudnabacteria bacterium]
MIPVSRRESLSLKGFQIEEFGEPVTEIAGQSPVFVLANVAPNQQSRLLVREVLEHPLDLEPKQRKALMEWLRAEGMRLREH